MESKELAVGQMLYIYDVEGNDPTPDIDLWRQFNVPLPALNNMPNIYEGDHCDVIGCCDGLALVKICKVHRYFVMSCDALETRPIKPDTEVELIEELINTDDLNKDEWFFNFRAGTIGTVQSSDRYSSDVILPNGQIWTYANIWLKKSTGPILEIPKNVTIADLLKG